MAPGSILYHKRKAYYKFFYPNGVVQFLHCT